MASERGRGQTESRNTFGVRTAFRLSLIHIYTGRFARELHVNGLVNVQYAVSNGKVYVIEVNPRSSRTCLLYTSRCV